MRRAHSSADAVMLGALCQAIIVKLHKLYTRNMDKDLLRALIEENKWRAARWGLTASDRFGSRPRCRARPPRSNCSSSSTTWSSELGSREAVEQVHRVLAEDQRDRQLAVIVRRRT